MIKLLTRKHEKMFPGKIKNCDNFVMGMSLLIILISSKSEILKTRAFFGPFKAFFAQHINITP